MMPHQERLVKEGPCLETVPCQLCGHDDSETVYEGFQECGGQLGRLPILLAMCRRCGFLYQNPRLSSELLDQYYAQESVASGSTFHSTEQGSRFHGVNDRRKSFFEHTLQQTGKSGCRRLLDVGCGAGDFLALLHGKSRILVGLEPSCFAGQVARKRGVEVVRQPLEQSGLPDSSFDAVFCHMVLEHVRDINRALVSLRRLLKPGGMLFLEIPDSTKPVPQVGEFFTFEHLSHFTPGTFARLLAKHDLAIVNIQTDEKEPRLRVCAVSAGGSSPDAIEVGDDREKMRLALVTYRDQVELLQRGVLDRLDRLAESWRNERRRVGLYGAGFHTQNLLKMGKFKDCICAVLDSDPKKEGSSVLSWKIHGPQSIGKLGLDVVLISSKAFQEEIYRSLLPYKNKFGFDIIKIYDT